MQRRTIRTTAPISRTMQITAIKMYNQVWGACCSCNFRTRSTFDHTCWTSLAISKIKQLGLLLQYNKHAQHCRSRPPVALVPLGFTQEAHASVYKLNNSTTSVDPYCIHIQNFSKISQCEELFMVKLFFLALYIGGEEWGGQWTNSSHRCM